jgi:hypothetical protein
MHTYICKGVYINNTFICIYMCAHLSHLCVSFQGWGGVFGVRKGRNRHLELRITEQKATPIQSIRSRSGEAVWKEGVLWSGGEKGLKSPGRKGKTTLENVALPTTCSTINRIPAAWESSWPPPPIPVKEEAFHGVPLPGNLASPQQLGPRLSPHWGSFDLPGRWWRLGILSVKFYLFLVHILFCL